MIDNKVVGQAISKLRQSENMTQQTLAACLNVSHQAVSKWENGAALPDVLLLLEISRMFGVTLEQLISGDIENRLARNAEKPASEKPKMEFKLTLGDEVDEAIDNVEKVVSDTMEAFENVVEPDDGAAEASAETVSIDKLIDMAPFMSRSALDEMVSQLNEKATPRQLSKLAPFVSSETLEKLIVDNNGEVNWDTLRRLAPFLKKEFVDALTIAVAKGEKYIKPAAKQVQRSTEDIGKTVYKGMNKVKEFAKKLGESLSGDSYDVHTGERAASEKPAEQPADQPKKRGADDARKRIFSRALADEKWDWIADHISQLDDDDMKRDIALKARDKGMNDWVKETLGDDFDTMTAEEAVINGNWEWLGEHMSEIKGDMHDMVIATAIDENRWDWIEENFDELELNSEEAVAVAKFAADNGEWEWLADNFDELDLDDPTDFALRAYEAGEKDAAAAFAEEADDNGLNMKLAEAALAKGDYDFVNELVENGDSDFADALCEKLAHDGDMAHAVEYAREASEDKLVELVDIATEAGDWEAIDKLNGYLD